MSEGSENNQAFCDRQPVVQNVQIQNLGFIFVLDFKFNIHQASVNAESFFGLKCSQLVQKKITDFLDPKITEIIEQRIRLGELQYLNGMVILLKGSSEVKSFSASFFSFESYWIMELEFIPEGFLDFSELIKKNKMGHLSLQLKHSVDLAEMCAKTVSELKSILNIDKVMIYKFDKSWHGTVLAEAMESDMDSYEGLKFPSTDIPEPARRLYFSSPVRMITGLDEPAVPIEPAVNPLTSQPSDLSKCILRGVNAVHLEYLKNMKVASSISASIMRDGALWGLIAFHHRSKKTLSSSVRNAIKNFAESFSSHLLLLEQRDKAVNLSVVDKFRELIFSTSMNEQNPLSVFSSQIGILSDAMNAQGMAFYAEGRWVVWGSVPVQAELDLLAEWLRKHISEMVYCVDNLSADYDGALSIKDTASGLIAASTLGVFEEMILWFRPEESRFVKWGGDPSQTVHFGTDKKVYHPRESFKTWKEAVKSHSVPWKRSEVNAASKIGKIFSETLHDFRTRKLRVLSGLLPICSYCKKIRDENDSWRVMEEYIQKRSKAQFSHGYCPDCYKKALKETGLEES